MHYPTDIVSMVFSPILIIFFPLQAITILEGLIPKKEDGSNVSASHLERLYIFCVMWSLGALLELDDRAKMEEFTKENFELDLPPIAEDSLDTIFEFLVNEGGLCLIQICRASNQYHFRDCLV